MENGVMSPAEAAEEVAEQISNQLQRTHEPMKAEVLIALAASWRTYAYLLTNKCTCGYGGQHSSYNKDCDLVPTSNWGF